MNTINSIVEVAKKNSPTILRRQKETYDEELQDQNIDHNLEIKIAQIKEKMVVLNKIMEDMGSEFNEIKIMFNEAAAINTEY